MDKSKTSLKKEEEGVLTLAGQMKEKEKLKKKKDLRSFQVMQWIRICLPIQETWVQSLVWEDSTCPRATKPVFPATRDSPAKQRRPNAVKKTSEKTGKKKKKSNIDKQNREGNQPL